MAIILILDDRATNRNIDARLATAIEPGVSVEVFADPNDALEWLEHNRVDLVMTDYKMPGMDGAEFTRRLRALPTGKTVPVVVVTAYDDRNFRLRALDAGATDFLQSPIDHFEIVTRARNLLALGRKAAITGALPSGPIPPPLPAEGQRAPAAADLQELARILDTVPAMISAADRDGRCVYANAALAAELNASVAELLGAPPERLFGPVRGARSRRHDLAVFQSGKAIEPYREDLPAGEGRHRCLVTSKRPLRNPSGEIAAVLTTSFEVTGVMLNEPGPSLRRAG